MSGRGAFRLANVASESEVASAHSLPGAAALLAFATAVVVTTEFIVVGLLPAMSRDLGISAAAAGWFVTWFALASALFGPPLTVVAGRFSPRAVLGATLLVFAFGNLAVVLAPISGVVATARIVQGAALPVLVSVGSAAVATIAGPGREGRAISRAYLGVVVANVVAVPAGVALAGTAGWTLSYAVLSIVSFLGALILAASFPPVDTPGGGSIKAQAAILRQPLVQAHLLLSAVIFAAMFGAYSYLAVFLETAAGFDSGRVAAALMGFGLAGVLGNWIAGRVVDRGPTVATARAATILILAMAGVSFVGGEVVWLLPLLAGWGATHTAVFLLCQVRIMLAAPAAPAFASSLNISACNVGIAAGAVVGGQVVDHLGIGSIGSGGAVLAACALVIALAIRRAFGR